MLCSGCKGSGLLCWKLKMLLEVREIDKFKLFLQGGVNTVHEFSCTRSVVCVHVTCMVITVYAVCEGLLCKTKM